ncbi:hypothetical protein ALC57_00264 [Trachymyrmex cornetzi]|uniref:Retrotransposon gag domain-containing protein n=1 Tax=Trachymyrmex cornetzi TaxID=471704 RepID=A0A151JSE5_9HYME|nr:hypothetical protein ALC57_00264 [Trachymyrmex cornetzi]
MIPPFDLARDDLTIEKWIQHVEGLAEHYGWNDLNRIRYMRLIPTHLKGHAKLWYDTRPEVAITRTTAKEMMQQFRKSVSFSKLLKDAALYETSRGQALGNYCFNKLSKLRKLDLVIPDKYLIDAVIGGITDTRV